MLYFISISAIFILWWIFKEIVKNHDLYWKKDDFEKKIKTFIFIFLFKRFFIL